MLLVTHLSLFPQPTRWGSWFNAALYYAKNLPEVKAIVESFVGFGILVNQEKVSLQKSGLAGQLLKIKHQHECLVKLIEKMESVNKKKNANKDISEIINTERQDISPAACHMLETSQPTSASVERSFFMLKNCWPRTEILRSRMCAIT